MRAQINGIDMAYEVSGPEDAPAILLHHTLATRCAMWGETAAQLANSYRVIAIDARGHGTSETPPPPYDFETLASDVTGLLDHLGIAQAHFMGSSMGGIVGQYLGILAPDRLRSLILVSTTSATPEAGKASWDERMANVREGGMRSQVDVTMARWFTEPFLGSDHPALKATETMIAETPDVGFLGWAAALRELDITSRLAAIACPTLVIVGEDDEGTPVSAAQTIHENIPGSELVIIEKASHQLPLERPEPFMAAVQEFLGRQQT